MTTDQNTSSDAHAHELQVSQLARESKIRLYKTAKARLACAHFLAGEFVSVEYSNTTNGVNWFMIHKTENKTLERPVAYPQHHLTEFCL